ncbi:YciI family protein [Gimesia aquarii]|uniref:YCII-related domain protein n=1 Tax=Gimesia aquarii TaxID=2527964 RepID=A0A517WQD2_9PLAN|nr:YciI family protein [Gimesia aquarii]QDU07463.1 YCII-related domain protein [Gimesia aquarii]
MPQFMFIYRGGAPQTPGISPEEMQAHLDRWWGWMNEFIDKGVLEPGNALELRGSVVSGDKVIADGPFVESKEMIGGFSILTAASLEEATEVAKGCPIYEYKGKVEVRPVVDNCGEAAPEDT